MKTLIAVPDSKAPSLLEILHNIFYLKIKQLTNEKALLMADVREAVEEMKLVSAGKKEARNAEDFLNELQG